MREGEIELWYKRAFSASADRDVADRSVQGRCGPDCNGKIDMDQMVQ